MNLLFWIIVFSLLGGVLSVMAAGSYLLLSERLRARTLPHLVSFAIGALLGAAFLALLPHALSEPGVEFHRMGLAILLGVLGFFLLEKMVLWRHHHGMEAGEIAHEHVEGRAAGTLILIGDGIHNMVDGVLIAAAFLTDFHLGVVTSLAVAAHEIPQEVGDFAILLHSGYSRARALVYNMLSSTTTVIGGVAAYYSLSGMHAALPYILSIAASSFIYIAVADLIPALHKRTQFRATVQQIVLIALGVILIYWTHSVLH